MAQVNEMKNANMQVTYFLNGSMVNCFIVISFYIERTRLDVPDNFEKYKTKTIPKNIILSNQNNGLKTRY